MSAGQDHDDRDNPGGRPSAYSRDYEAVARAMAEGFVDEARLEVLDEARYAESPARSDDEDDDYHLTRQWPLYLLNDERVTLLALPPRLVARLRRLSDARLGTLVLRALEEYATRHEAEIPPPVPGSAPTSIPLYQPPVVADAVPGDEVAALAKQLAQRVLKNG